MDNLIEQLRHIILEAGKIALTNFTKIKCIEKKVDNSLVSNVDKEIDSYISRRLQILTPDIPIVSEEGFQQDSEKQFVYEKFWLVDPIDGTQSYINQKESYTINIALIHYYNPIIGLIYMPSKDLLYYTDGNGSVIAENKGIPYCIKDCSSGRIKDQPGLTAAVSSLYNKKINKFVENYNISQVIRIPSSIKLCMVADGSADLYPRFGKTMEWDTAAGHALIKSVGGDIFCNNGQPLLYGKRKFVNPNFIACNKYILQHNLLFDKGIF